jgi:hypothetical protein
MDAASSPLFPAKRAAVRKVSRIAFVKVRDPDLMRKSVGVRHDNASVSRSSGVRGIDVLDNQLHAL